MGLLGTFACVALLASSSLSEDEPAGAGNGTTFLDGVLSRAKKTVLGTDSDDKEKDCVVPRMVMDALASIGNARCRNDSAYFLNELDNLAVWAVKMLDSSSKVPSGILEGNIKDLGNFDECLSVRAISQADGDEGGLHERYRGKYCLVRLQMDVVPDAPHQKLVSSFLDMMTGGRRFLEDTDRRGVSYYPSFAKIQWAACVPSSCDAGDLEDAVNGLLEGVAERVGVHASAHVEPHQCSVDEPLAFHPRDYVIGAGALFMCLLLGAASAYDLFTRRKKEKEMFTKEWSHSTVLLAFSVPSNIRKLVNMEVPPGTIKCVDGIRFLTICWVIFTHKVFCMTVEPWTNKNHLLELGEGIQNMPFLNSMLDVDTFFLIGGMVRCYTLLKELDTNKFNYFISFFQRYLRLTPAYAAMIAFFATVYVYLGSGPEWYNGVEYQSRLCRENWIWNILYVNNYVERDSKCMLQSWYLSADMHLFLFAPLIVYPMWKWPIFGKILLAGCVCAAVAIPLATVLVYHYPGVHYISLHDDMLSNYAKYMYYPTHQRMAPYFVGMALGYLMNSYRNENCTLPKWVSATFWTLSIAILSAVIFGPFELMQFHHTYNVIESSIFGGFSKLAWAISISWIIFACHKGYGGLVDKGLSSKLFRPLSRLTYCIFLTHLGVLHYGVATMKSAKYMDEYHIMREFLCDVVVSCILSVFLYISFESPFLTITRVFTDKLKKIGQKSSSSSNMVKPVA